ncbi:MAG: LacI family DNA-binding transcriptional regulator [Burkholderiales bacterium]|jgi:LacI family transcriptional regulator
MKNYDPRKRLKVQQPRMSTLQDVAKELGLSAGTVSRAITRPDLVAPKTQKRIQEVIKKLHYIPHAGGRSLRSLSSGTIGAVIPKSGISTFSQTTLALQDELTLRGKTLIVSQPDNLATEIEKSIRKVLEHGVDGLLLLGENHSADTLSLLKNRGVPFVLMWNVKRSIDQPFVTVSQSQAGSVAAKHLLELGHKDFAFIGTPLSVNPRAAARLSGVKRTLAKAGLEIPEHAISEELHQFEKAGEATRKILVKAPRTTAIICTSDFHALGALRTLQELGMRVPEDISLVSFNNNDFSGYTYPSLTTVDLRQYEVGTIAAKMISQMIESVHPDNTILKPILRLRESSGPKRSN